MWSALLDFLDSDRAKGRWGEWKGVRCVIAWSIWFFRFRHHDQSIRPIPPGGRNANAGATKVPYGTIAE
jgi:hypothetical protein